MRSYSIDTAESEVDITWAAEEEEDEVDCKAATDGWHMFGREWCRATNRPKVARVNTA